jgi:hypothetical protein
VATLESVEITEAHCEVSARIRIRRAVVCHTVGLGDGDESVDCCEMVRNKVHCCVVPFKKSERPVDELVD